MPIDETRLRGLIDRIEAVLALPHEPDDLQERLVRLETLLRAQLKDLRELRGNVRARREEREQ